MGRRFLGRMLAVAAVVTGALPFLALLITSHRITEWKLS